MKILIVHPGFGFYGGAERVIVELVNYLTDRNHPTTILTTGMAPEVRRELKDARLVVCKDFYDMNDTLRGIRNDFDVINIHNSPCHLTVRGTTVPTVWSMNEPTEEWFDTGKVGDNEIGLVREFIDRIVVADEFNSERAKTIYGDDKNVAVVPYGINYDYFSEGNPRWVKAKYGLEGKRVVFHPGFVHPQKNQLESIRAVSKMDKDVVLVLAGQVNQEYAKDLDGEIVKLGMMGRVINLGFLSQSDLRDVYHASDVIVFPLKKQGGWLSVFDAISTGRPVVVTTGFTAVDIISEHKLAIVVGPAELSEGIRRALGGEKAEGSVDWIRDNLAPDKYCSSMLRVFEEARNDKIGTGI